MRMEGLLVEDSPGDIHQLPMPVQLTKVELASKAEAV
jgi:hypothetical protein